MIKLKWWEWLIILFGIASVIFMIVASIFHPGKIIF
jgi:hypothetical protein